MDIAKFTEQHDDNRCDARHRMTSLDVTTSDTGVDTHSARARARARFLVEIL